MAGKPGLIDRFGHPLRRGELRHEVAAPKYGSVRSPLSGYPADGLDPLRLAQILREADQGDPVRYLELAETIEERDPHYLGVLATRKRSVSQIEISVEAASDAARDIEKADMVRAWLKRDELTEEIFDILDCIGKGYSFTEIIWDTSMGQWRPARLEYRDPRWFRFERHNLSVPIMLDDQGDEVPLPAFKFIFAQIKAKSGIALRSGLARVAAWGWMFKAFTQRDWAIFTQTYGQPLRVGKYGAGASEHDRDTLFGAVANIAGDCAAIIPESMQIEFVEAGNLGAASDLYERRSDWLDRQISKAVLGQTATTDAIAGGHAVGQEHRQVQQDIECADARALSAILNRDLIRPWMDLEYGPQPQYPRLTIARPEREDLAGLATALGTLVPLGLRVRESEVRDKYGLSQPTDGEDILGQATPPSAAGIPATQAMQAAEGDPAVVEDLLADRMLHETTPDMLAMLEKIETMIGAAGSLAEMRQMLLAAYPTLDAGPLAETLATALIAANAGGRATLEADSG